MNKPSKHKHDIRVIGYTPAELLEIFHDRELMSGNSVPPAKRVFLQHRDGALIPFNGTIIVMYGDYD